MSLDSVQVEYDVEIDKAVVALLELKRRNAELGKDLEAGEKKQQDGVKKTDTAYKGLNRTLGMLKAQIAAVFAIGMIKNYGNEAVELAKKVAAVERAFKRLDDPTLLNKLRIATKGTISDLDLMAKANLAASFNLPMDQLDSLAEFAVLKAAETGQSVDYMYDSIITGIARGSIMILDNLGISSRALREEMNGASIRSAEIGDVTAAVARIASRQIDGMRMSWDEAAGSIMATQTNLQNLKAQIGQTLIPVQGAILNFVNQAMTQLVYFGDAWRGAFGDVSKASDEGVLALVRSVKVFSDLEATFNKTFGELSDENLDDFIVKLQELYGLNQKMIAFIEGTGDKRFHFDIGREQVRNYREYMKVLGAVVKESQAMGNITNYSATTQKQHEEAVRKNKKAIKDANSVSLVYTDLGRKLANQTAATAMTIDEIKEELKALEGAFDSAKVGSAEYNRIIQRTGELTTEANKRSEAWAKVIGRIGIVSGSIADLTWHMTELQKQQEKATTPAQWDAIQKKLDEYQKRIDNINGTSLKEMKELQEQINELIFGAGATEEEKAIAEIQKRYKATIDAAKLAGMDVTALEKAQTDEIEAYRALKAREANEKELADYYDKLQARKALGTASIDELYELETKALGEALAKGQISYKEYYDAINQVRAMFGMEGLMGESVEIDKTAQSLEMSIGIMEMMLPILGEGTQAWYEMQEAIKEARKELEMWSGEVPASTEKTKEVFDSKDLGRTALYGVQNLFRTALLERERMNGEELAMEIEKNQALLDSAKITEEQKAALDSKAKTEAAEKSKELATFNTLLAVAEAFLQGLLRGGPLVGAAYAAIAGAQQAVINGISIPAFATGVVGYQGYGTPTSDSNLVKISDNESIMTSKATNKHGALLTAMNADNDSIVRAIVEKNYVDRITANAVNGKGPGEVHVTVKNDMEGIGKDIRQATRQDIEMQAIVGREVVRAIKGKKKIKQWN